jgi:hypothetical protein
MNVLCHASAGVLLSYHNLLLLYWSLHTYHGVHIRDSCLRKDCLYYHVLGMSRD